MLRLLVSVFIVGVCALSIPAIIQSNPEAFERGLEKGVDNARKVIAAERQIRKPKPRVRNLSGRKVRLAMNDRGHFVTDFKLNGRRVNALVDTGATLVAINQSTARRIGLRIKASDFKYDVRTANGNTKAASAVIKTVQIGRIHIKNVQAAILSDQALDGTLVGMSFLKQLKSFKIENQALILQQ